MDPAANIPCIEHQYSHSRRIIREQLQPPPRFEITLIRHRWGVVCPLQKKIYINYELCVDVDQGMIAMYAILQVSTTGASDKVPIALDSRACSVCFFEQLIITYTTTTFVMQVRVSG